MAAFRILLVCFIIAIISYTGVVIYHHGWNLFPVFFGDMAAMTWPGQFNLDFMGFDTIRIMACLASPFLTRWTRIRSAGVFWRNKRACPLSPYCQL